MPSLHHEALLELFRNRPVLAPELIRDILRIELPAFQDVRLEDTSLTEIVPTEYRADLVLLLYQGVPVFGIVVEAQLSRDDDKLFTWPLYGVALRARLRIPCCVLVVAPQEAVARWAAKPIDTGQPRVPFAPLVIGPGAVPYVSDLEEAKRAPELAVLSALAHGQEEAGVKVALAAIGAADTLDDQQGRLYTDLVLSAMSEATRSALEDMMASGNYEYQSDFAKKYFSQGKAEGKAEVLLKIFGGRGIAVSEQQRRKVLACSDIPTLDRWIDRAFQVRTADETLE